MKNKTTIFLGRCAIGVLFLFGLCICFWWYPFSISLGTIGLVSGESNSTIPVTREQNIAFWVQMIFAWVTSFPCFTVLGMWLKSIGYVKRNEAFSKKNAALFKTAALVLFVDAVILIAGNAVFVFMEWNPFALVYFLMGILGIIVAAGNFAAYCYLKKAIIIQEENDSIL